MVRLVVTLMLLSGACTPETLVSDVQRINVRTGGSCTSNTECVNGHDCAAGVCLKRDGQACADGVECISALCDNDVCAETTTGDVDTGGACLTTSECRAGHVCSDFVCLRWLGEPCTAPVQCDSRFCADDICCTSACDAPCDASCGAGGICHGANGIDCDDNDACTTGDACADGICQSGDVDISCLGTGAFADVSAAADVRGVPNANGEWGNTYGVAWADFDNDGHLDLWIGGSGPEDLNGDPLYQGRLYQNDGDGTFTRVLDAPQGARAGYWADPDNDGDVDLFTTADVTVAPGDGTASRLYVNDGSGGFTLEEVGVGLDGASNLGNAVWLDANNDGWSDLFFPNGNGITSKTPGPNQIRLNDANPKALAFTIYTDAGLATHESNGEACTAADVDNDGDIDIWYNDELEGSLYVNQGGSFIEAAATAGLAIDMGSEPDREQPYYAPVFGDYNNDGWLDLFLGHPDGIANRLYTNQGAGSPTFVLETTVELLAVDLGHSRGADWGDVDHDGDLDLVVGNEKNNVDATALEPAANALFENRGVAGFVDVAATLGLDAAGIERTGSVSFADYDNDGDLDIYVANRGVASVLWRNELNDDKYLKVRVIGAGAGASSRDGVGTRVELWDADQVQLLAIREVSGGGGYGAHPPSVLHFGLAAGWGGAAGSYALVARFLSGAVRTLDEVVPNRASLTVGSASWQNAVEILE